VDLGISGRRAAVAAASAGLGFATAQALAEAGVRVALCGRDRARAEAAAARIGRGTVAFALDVATEGSAERFVREAREALGGLDILVCNAGGPPPGTFASTDLAAYRAAIDQNLISTIAMCREAVPGMQAQRWGRVVAITSLGVRQPIATLIASVTARAGATGFLKVLAREVARDGVTVNSLQPGLHATERVASLTGGNRQALESLAASIPARVMGEAADFGRIAAFLCSEHARFVTGCAIPVDGGADAALM
jgi:3-oxoacyl-[acyl-carrier protein] reductase